MAQLAAQEKFLYYPTDLEPLRLWVQTHVGYNSMWDGASIFDPCAGEGKALECLATELGKVKTYGKDKEYKTYGVELDGDRADLAKERLSAIVHGPMEIMDYQGQCDLMFENPPYDTYQGERVEWEWMNSTLPAVGKEGAVILILKEELLTGKMGRKCARILNNHGFFKDLKYWRFPEPWYSGTGQFKQALLFARKDGYTFNGERELTFAGVIGEGNVTVDISKAYTGRDNYSRSGSFFVGKSRMRQTPKTAFVDEKLPKPLWEFAGNATQTEQFRPLAPVSDETAAVMTAGGLLSSAVVGERYVIKGDTIKKQVELEGEGGDNQSVTVDRQVTRISLLDLENGNVERFNHHDDPERFNEFFDEYAQELVDITKSLYPPLYDGTINEKLHKVRAPRAIDGKVNGLFPAQLDRASALLEGWKHMKSLILMGEMGVGKTPIALAAAACFENTRRIVVLLPSKNDLANKWAEEAERSLSNFNAWAMHCTSVTEVQRAFETRNQVTFKLRGTGVNARMKRIMHTIHFAQVQGNTLLLDTKKGQRYTLYDCDGDHNDYEGSWRMFAKPECSCGRQHTSNDALTGHCLDCGKELDVYTLSLGDDGFVQFSDIWASVTGTYELADEGLGVILIKESMSKMSSPWLPLNNGETMVTLQRPRDWRVKNLRKRDLSHVPWKTNIGKSKPKKHRLIQANLRCSSCGEPISYYNKDKEEYTNPFKVKCNCKKCKAPLWQITSNGKGRRFPLAKFIREHFNNQYVLIMDEAHNYKGGKSARGYAAFDLMSGARRVLAMTGTLYNGFASSIFHILFRTNKAFRDLFDARDESAFVNEYGLHKTVRTYTSERRTTAAGYNEGEVTSVREIPGMSPQMLVHLLPMTVTLKMRDVADNLPGYEEHTLYVDPDEQLMPYYAHLEAIYDEAIERLKDEEDRDTSLMAMYNFADKGCWDIPQDVTDEFDSGLLYEPDFITKKEEAWLRLLLKFPDSKILTSVSQTSRRDVSDRLVELAKRFGIKAVVLRSSVKERKPFVKKALQEGARVIITNAELVKEGIDLIEFNVSIWFGQTWNLYTLAQFNRRSWRIGQTKDCYIFYLGWNATPQAELWHTMAQKSAAQQALEGDIRAGLAAILGEDDFINTLQSRVVTRTHRDSDWTLADLPELPEQVQLDDGNTIDGECEVIEMPQQKVTFNFAQQTLFSPESVEQLGFGF